MRVDIEYANELRPQWHHDHEIQDMGKLNARQGKQEEALLFLGFNNMHRGTQWALYLGHSL